MFKKAIITILFGALLAGCSSSAPLKTSSAVNPEINISEYKTFSWISEQPYIPSGTFLADSTRDRIKAKIYNELINKGYVFVYDPMAADFVVSYTIGSRKEINAKSYPTYYQSGWNLGTAYWGGGGVYIPGTYSRGARYTGTTTNIRTYTEGTLAIDVFDVKMAQGAWHGVGLKEITSSDRKNVDPLVREAVTKILKAFPSAS